MAIDISNQWVGSIQPLHSTRVLTTALQHDPKHSFFLVVKVCCFVSFSPVEKAEWMQSYLWTSALGSPFCIYSFPSQIFPLLVSGFPSHSSEALLSLIFSCLPFVSYKYDAFPGLCSLSRDHYYVAHQGATRDPFANSAYVWFWSLVNNF